MTPCIASSPHVTQDLLPSHNITITTALSHWDRDSFAHPPLNSTVSESQAYEGMRKIVLAESNSIQALRHTVHQILRLNNGRLRERIEAYDWRVLEECTTHATTADLLKRHLIGATRFHETEQRAIFVSTIPGLGHND